MPATKRGRKNLKLELAFTQLEFSNHLIPKKVEVGFISTAAPPKSPAIDPHSPFYHRSIART